MIYGVGNAVMDVRALVSDDFLLRHGVEKGLMTLADLSRSQSLLKALEDERIAVTRTAGGSVANSIAGIAAAGGVDTTLFFRVGG